MRENAGVCVVKADWRSYVGAYEQRSFDERPCGEVSLCFVVREIPISDFELSSRCYQLRRQDVHHSTYHVKIIASIEVSSLGDERYAVLKPLG